MLAQLTCLGAPSLRTKMAVNRILFPLTSYFSIGGELFYRRPFDSPACAWTPLQGYAPGEKLSPLILLVGFLKRGKNQVSGPLDFCFLCFGTLW